MLQNLLSHLNARLRKLAQRLLPSGRLRRYLSQRWTGLLAKMTSGIVVPIGPDQIVLLPAYRNISPNYEQEALEVWRKLVKRGSVVWDIGANIGIYTIISGRLVGTSGEVVGFEPTPFTHQVAEKHIELNKLTSHCRVEPFAVSDQDGATLDFQVCQSQGSDEVNPTNRLGTEPTATTVKVSVVSLDGLAMRLQRKPAVLKIDIEGAEVHALRGASLLLRSIRPIIQLAVHPMFLPEFNCAPDEIASIVTENNYISLDIYGRPSPPTQYAEYILIPRENIRDACLLLNWPVIEAPVKSITHCRDHH